MNDILFSHEICNGVDLNIQFRKGDTVKDVVKKMQLAMNILDGNKTDLLHTDIKPDKLDIDSSENMNTLLHDAIVNGKIIDMIYTAKLGLCNDTNGHRLLMEKLMEMSPQISKKYGATGLFVIDGLTIEYVR